MTYLDPVNDSGKKVKPPKPVKQPKEKRDDADPKPPTSRRNLLLILGAILVIVIAGVVAAILTLNSLNVQHEKDQKIAAAQDKKVAQSTLVSDVKQTAENAKAYLKKNPKASLDQMIGSINTVNHRIAKGETISIATSAMNPKLAWTTWIVRGTDPSFNKNLGYEYQSYTNTFRYLNNTTGVSTGVIEDKTARNAGACSGVTTDPSYCKVK